MKPAPLPRMSRALPTAADWRQASSDSRARLPAVSTRGRVGGGCQPCLSPRCKTSSGSTAWFVHGRSLLWPEGDFFGLTCKATRVRTQQLCCGARLTPGASSGLCTLCCTRPAACLRTRPPSSLSIVRARPSSPPHQPPGTHGSVHRTWALGGDRMVSLLRAPDTRVLTRVQNLFLFLSLFRTFGDLWASPLGSPAGHGRPACKGAG